MGLSTNREHAYQFIIGNTKVPLFYMPFQNPNIMELTHKKEFNRTQTIGGQAFEHWGEQPTIMHVSMRIRKNSYAGNIIGTYQERRYDLEDPMVCTELEMMKLMYHLDRRKLKYTAGDLLPGVKGGTGLLVGSSPKSTSVLSVATGKVGSIVTSSVSKGSIIKTADFTELLSNSALSSNKATESPNAVTEYLNKISDTVIIFKANIYSGFFTDFKVTEDAQNAPFFNTVTFDFLVTSTFADSIYDSIADTTIGRTLSTVAGIATTVSAVGYTTDSVSTGIESLKEGLF